jgi:hypothetical protein
MVKRRAPIGQPVIGRPPSSVALAFTVAHLLSLVSESGRDHRLTSNLASSAEVLAIRLFVSRQSPGTPSELCEYSPVDCD